MCNMVVKWDDAVKRRNRDEMVAVLRKVAMSVEQAQETTDAVLKNPTKYGF